MNDIEKAIETLKARSEFVAEINIDARVAYEMAIEALEKQIPRQPKWTQIYDTCISPDDYEFVCPACEEVIEYEQQICLECYQVIDWSVEE